VLELDRPLPRLDQPLHVTRTPYADSPPLQAASMTIGPLSKWDRLLSLAGATDTRFGLVTFATMVPEERNQYGPEVCATVAHAHERLDHILARAGIQARFNCPLTKLVPGAAAHYGGAARMHASPEYGVLDGWNRLHDARNVAVVDASSFTTAVEKNPTLTAMALAARAAERIARDILASTDDSTPEVSDAVPSLR
jgi:choline dehydrogenase-like flavoprotein